MILAQGHGAWSRSLPGLAADRVDLVCAKAQTICHRGFRTQAFWNQSMSVSGSRR
jgi:hypothetical protein